jgi:peptidoglycan hydrolase CwlO-like protein
LFTKSMALESEAQDKTSRLHNLTLQNTQLQTNNNNILQMLETYEVKVNSQNKKIKQLEAEIKDYNESLLSLRKEN